MFSGLNDRGKWILSNVLIWCLAKQLFLAIKLWGIENTFFQYEGFSSGPLFLATGISGMLNGLLFGLAEVLYDRWFKNVSFATQVLLRGLSNLILGLTMTIVLVPILVGLPSTAGIALVAGILISPNLIVALVYFMLITAFVQVFKQVMTWVYSGSFYDLLSRSNVEEDRIFLFLDMKSSTRHAEVLGPRKYSSLIQDCFQDISIAVDETCADVYQYRGDEAVLTWNASDVNVLNAVTLHFRFKEILQLRSREYERKYGVIPEFKAGIHHGKVVKAQVGVVRKEIAFHGDAINTASRIQRKCSELMCDLLVSEKIREQLPRYFRCEWEGNHQLKGKELELNLYSIRRRVAIERSLEVDF